MMKRQLSILRRYLGGVAATLDVVGLSLSQSRRVMGQFTNEEEVTGFGAVHLWSHRDVEMENPLVTGLFNDVARFHRTKGRGDYCVYYHHLDPSPTPSLITGLGVKQGNRSSGWSLIRPMKDLAAGTIPEEILKRQPARGKPHRDDLVILLMDTAQQDPPEEYLAFAGKARPDRCLWVFIKEEYFVPEREFARSRNQIQQP